MVGWRGRSHKTRRCRGVTSPESYITNYTTYTKKKKIMWADRARNLCRRRRCTRGRWTRRRSWPTRRPSSTAPSSPFATPSGPCSTPSTLHPTPYTLHPTPCTLHPTPYTQHPSPYPLNHNLCYELLQSTKTCECQVREARLQPAQPPARCILVTALG